ncbi:MAG TPA: glycosyltransferase family 4 protein [Burkholderiales bacterium]|nr:glycosyltransferase family 4 protein [Burkholderiales bacterium]
MRICFLGLENLPVLAPEYRAHRVGGEAVQQTLLARALARRGHEVSMVTGDYGQADGTQWDGIRVFAAYHPDAGVPVLRFVHPRWTGTWSALARADADIYYTSCAGMQAGLVALFCRQYRKRFVFRAASDTDCDRDRVLLKFARDRWLYAYGLRRADAILVQSAAQAAALRRSYGLASRVAGMLVEPPAAIPPRDIDVLWIANIQGLKRPERFLELARLLPDATLHMAGGCLPGAEALFEDIRGAAAARPNVRFHGGLPYRDAGALYGRARVFVNTSDIEGFPNSYLQAWIRGVPVVTLIDPDGVIEREGLGIAVASPGNIADAVRHLLSDPAAWRAASERCRAFMAREYGEDRIISAYIDTFEGLRRPPARAGATVITQGAPRA